MFEEGETHWTWPVLEIAKMTREWQTINTREQMFMLRV